MRSLRSSLCLFVFFLIFTGHSTLIAQCSSSSCTNANTVCPSSNCCDSSVGNPNSINSTPVATVDEVGYYNCHQFVKAYLYGEHTGVSILDCDNGSTCPCKEYNNSDFTVGAEFVRVQWEWQAQAIYYPCDHSAVRLGTYNYMSKDGHGGHLYTHGPTAYVSGVAGCYPVTHWAFLGKIGGFSGTTINAPVQLSLKNNSAITYEWCANPSSLVDIQDEDTANPTITPLGNGNVQIKVKTTGFNSTKTQCKNFNVALPCGNTYISGIVSTAGSSSSLSYYNNIFSYNSQVKLTSSSVHHYTWEKISGNAGYSISFNGKNANLYMVGGQFLKFNITAYSAGGQCLGKRTVFFQCSTIGGNWWNTQVNTIEAEELSQQSSLDNEEDSYTAHETIFPNLDKAMVYPNPAFDQLNIELPKGTIKSIGLFDVNGKNVLQKSPRNQSRSHQLDVSQMNTGIYYVRIVDEKNETVIKKILIQ